MSTLPVSPDKKIEYAALLYIIDQGGVSRAELEGILKGEPARISDALGRLRDQGAVTLDGDLIRPCGSARYYKLSLSA